MIKRIFVLDDNQDILELIKEVLQYENFEVFTTSECEDILETIQGFGPDLIILDYKLNGPNGDDICKRIKANPYLNYIPVILCSAYFNKYTNPLNCEYDAFIAKPFDLEELLDKVNSLIEV